MANYLNKVQYTDFIERIPLILFVKACGVSMTVLLLTFKQPFSWHTHQPRGPITWPPHSPDLTPCNFLLRESIEENIYATKYKTATTCSITYWQLLQASWANPANWLMWGFHWHCCEAWMWDGGGNFKQFCEEMHESMCKSLLYEQTSVLNVM
jgi:hypothetical protein